MAKKKIIHYAVNHFHNLGCGVEGNARFTVEQHRVTCKRCIKYMEVSHICCFNNVRDSGVYCTTCGKKRDVGNGDSGKTMKTEAGQIGLSVSDGSEHRPNIKLSEE